MFHFYANPVIPVDHYRTYLAAWVQAPTNCADVKLPLLFPYFVRADITHVEFKLKFDTTYYIIPSVELQSTIEDVNHLLINGQKVLAKKYFDDHYLQLCQVGQYMLPKTILRNLKGSPCMFTDFDLNYFWI